MISPFLSICIPAYNRPQEIIQLLNSIDCLETEVEVVICEDYSPKRDMIREQVNLFSKHSKYCIKYIENHDNLGFDGNLRQLIKKSNGEFIIFMGDDDLFVSDTLDKYILFLKNNHKYNYILRSYISIHENGAIEKFNYLPKTTPIDSGEDSVAWLFKRSVNLSGFTISREEALKYSTTKLDGTLLYQVYLMAQVCLHSASIYCDIAVTQAVQTWRKDTPMFGASPAEKGRYTPGKVTNDNSLNFTKSYFEVAQYLDRLHGTKLEKIIKISLSKNSYPFLSIQRKRGVTQFLNYSRQLELQYDFGITFYYHIYKWSLVFLGEKICDRVIMFIKNRLGYTPNL
jgi:abequosyltransferase